MKKYLCYLIDLYEADKANMCCESLLVVTYFDIWNYFIHKKSIYNMQELCAWKSLNMFNQSKWLG